METLLFPNVPSIAELLDDAEVVGFDETKEGKARSDMTMEERFGAAHRRKMDGALCLRRINWRRPIRNG
uniref:Uncharacterized protein n=1 Tax=Arabidopsis thaliana TaxID=3702 RepID=Q570T1_ARATH|nr:hypothetical protein [Arabidopsis thaliana]